MRLLGFLVLAALACGAPDLSLSPPPALPTSETSASPAPNAEFAGVASSSPLTIPTASAPRVRPVLLARPPDDPFTQITRVFPDTGCRFVRPPFAKAPEPVPAPRLCAVVSTDETTRTSFDAVGRPIESYVADSYAASTRGTRLDEKGRVTYAYAAFRGVDEAWYGYDDADVERVALLSSAPDDRLWYAAADIAPDCSSIRWQWWWRDRAPNAAWNADYSRVEEFDASGVLVAVEVTSPWAPSSYRTTYLHHWNGAVSRAETTRDRGSFVSEFDSAGRVLSTEERDAAGVVVGRTELAYDSAGRRVSEVRTRGGADTYRYSATYDADAHLLTSEEYTPERTDVTQRTYEATYDAGGHLLHSLEYKVDRRNNSWKTEAALQWSDDLLLREDRARRSSGGESREAEVHAYDSRGRRVRTSFDKDGDGDFDAFTRFAYDAAGHLLREEHSGALGDSYRRRFAYDAAGRRTFMGSVDGYGSVTETRWTWCE